MTEYISIVAARALMALHGFEVREGKRHGVAHVYIRDRAVGYRGLRQWRLYGWAQEALDLESPVGLDDAELIEQLHRLERIL